MLVKTGEKNIEKEFLGYEFSERSKQEGIKSTNKYKTIEESTKLFDPNNPENPEKASTYI